MAERHEPVYEDGLPMPWGRFRLFLWVWHGLYLGALLMVLGVAIVQDGRERPVQVAILALCVLGQALLYIPLVMRQEQWPLPLSLALLYFGGSAGLWLIQWELDMRFLWVGWVYVGQMFGLLQPRYAIPGSALLVFYFFARAHDWAITEISVGEVLTWLSMVILFLYMYGLGRASMDRAGLVSELRKAQAELEAARRNDVELAALRERERLARDLHDGLGHTLAALSIQLEAVQRLYRVDPARASAQVDALKDLVRASMEELRRSLAGLRAPGLAGQPLPAALEGLCDGLRRRSGIMAACYVVGDVARLPPAVNDVLWRVAQEALTNVEKHAQAQAVELTLEIAPHAVMLSVCDDGVGLAHSQSDGQGSGVPGSRLGLLGMAERVEGVGGQLQVKDRPSGGVCVRAEIPLLGVSG